MPAFNNGLERSDNQSGGVEARSEYLRPSTVNLGFTQLERARRQKSVDVPAVCDFNIYLQTC